MGTKVIWRPHRTARVRHEQGETSYIGAPRGRPNSPRNDDTGARRLDSRCSARGARCGDVAYNRALHDHRLGWALLTMSTDRLVLAMFGLDALVLIGLVTSAVGTALGISGAVWWPAYLGAGVAVVALVGRHVVTRKLRPNLSARRRQLRLGLAR